MKLNLPEDVTERWRQRQGTTDKAKIELAEDFGSYWETHKEAITTRLADEGDWDKLDYRKAHRIYVESAAGSIKASASEMYSHSRLYRNVFSRKLHEIHDVFSYGQWDSLLRNIKQEKGLVDSDELQARIKWMYSEADKHSGELPSTRDIDNYYKQNSDIPEDMIYWKRIVNNAKSMSKLNNYSDARIMLVVLEIIRLHEEIEEEQNDSVASD